MRGWRGEGGCDGIGGAGERRTGGHAGVRTQQGERGGRRRRRSVASTSPLDLYKTKQNKNIFKIKILHI